MTTAWHTALAGLVIVAAAGLAGCGGGPSHAGVASLTNSGGNAATTTTVGKQTLTQLWHDAASCMRQHGVNMPDPVLNSDGLPTSVAIEATGPKAATEAANQACQAKLAAAMKAGGAKAGPPSAAMLAQLARFAKCMRSHGVPDFPDPNTAGGGIKIQSGSAGGTGGAPSGDLSPDSPAFKNAQKACGGLLGGKLGAPQLRTQARP